MHFPLPGQTPADTRPYPPLRQWLQVNDKVAHWRHRELVHRGRSRRGLAVELHLHVCACCGSVCVCALCEHVRV